MRSTRTTKGTEQPANAIAGHTQGNKGNTMPAVPVSQKKEVHSEQDAIQKKENQTGLPDNLKSGIETLSGFSMDNTRVHYNSSKPAQLNAFAYAQGTDIHVAPGQEKHLPHEAWHVVQQAQGKVKPTMQMKSGVAVNDDASLETEADVMGNSAATTSATLGQLKSNGNVITAPGAKVAQLAGTKPNQPTIDGRYRVKLSSEREAFTYTNRAALGLDTILPPHHEVLQTMATNPRENNRKIDMVRIASGWVTLKETIPAPAGNQRVLCIDTVGWNDERLVAPDQRDRKCVMDIKIGTYTKSTEQFKLEGAGLMMRFFKRVEHNIKDKKRDNRETGYDIDAENLTDFNAKNAGATRGPLHNAMDALIPKLTDIRTRMAAAPITFVGSSLFIVFNLSDAARSDVKLIDPDHPIVIDPGEIRLPGQLIKRSNFEGQERTWDQYVTKWRGSFGTGMDNFLAWFRMTAGQR
jgi:hypothetical protein